MQDVLVRPGVRDADHHQHIEWVGLGIVDLDDPVAVLVERFRVEQFELGVALAPPRVLLDELAIRELPLRVVVAPAIPCVTRDGVEVPPVLLGVLSVVALVAGEPEDALLEDRVASIPQGEPQAQALLHVGEAGKSVLAPAVRARPGVVVWQVLPGRTARAVVLADGAPLPFTDVRAPQVPVARLAKPVLETTEGRDALALGVQSARRSIHGLAALDVHRRDRPIGCGVAALGGRMTTS